MGSKMYEDQLTRSCLFSFLLFLFLSFGSAVNANVGGRGDISGEAIVRGGGGGSGTLFCLLFLLFLFLRRRARILVIGLGGMCGSGGFRAFFLHFLLFLFLLFFPSVGRRAFAVGHSR